MGNDFIYIYIIVHVFYLVSAVYIFTKVNGDVMRQSEHSFFRIFVSVYMMYLVLSAVWSLQEYNEINLPYNVFYVICFMTMYSVVLNGLFFYVFTMIRMLPEFARKKIYRYISVVPATSILIMMLISISNGMIFTVTPDKHIIYEKYYFLVPALTSGYLLIIFIASITNLIKNPSVIKKKESATLAFSLVIIGICVVIDAQFDKTTILPMAIFTAIFFIFVNLQESSIYTDALTGMNNRRKATEYLSSQLENISDESPLYIYLCDANYFKKINDVYGHAEGDQALIIISSAIKSTISKYRGFAARLGGDEFIMALHPSENSSPDDINVIKLRSDL